MRERLVDCYSRQTDQRNPPSAAVNDPHSYLEVYRIGFPLQAARPKFRPSSEALACLNNQDFSKVCYRVKPAHTHSNRMFAHYSKSDMAFVSITTIRRFKKIRRLRHGFYKHAYRTLDSTHWFRKLFFTKSFSLFESYLKTIRSYLNEYDKTQYLSTPTYRRNQTVGKGGSGSAFSSFFGVYHLLRLQCRDIRQQ